jgi:hypothetical protein
MLLGDTRFPSPREALAADADELVDEDGCTGGVLVREAANAKSASTANVSSIEEEDADAFSLSSRSCDRSGEGVPEAEAMLPWCVAGELLLLGRGCESARPRRDGGRDDGSCCWSTGINVSINSACFFSGHVRGMLPAIDAHGNGCLVLRQHIAVITVAPTHHGRARCHRNVFCTA